MKSIAMLFIFLLPGIPCFAVTAINKIETENYYTQRQGWLTFRHTHVEWDVDTDSLWYEQTTTTERKIAKLPKNHVFSDKELRMLGEQLQSSYFDTSYSEIHPFMYFIANREVVLEILLYVYEAAKEVRERGRREVGSEINFSTGRGSTLVAVICFSLIFFFILGYMDTKGPTPWWLPVAMISLGVGVIAFMSWWYQGFLILTPMIIVICVILIGGFIVRKKNYRDHKEARVSW